MRALTRLMARNTVRRRARSILTAGMVVLGVALILIALTWIRGVFGSMMAYAAALNGHVRIVDRDFAEREELMPLDEHIEQIEPIAEMLTQRAGAARVEPRITAGVTVTVGEEIGEIFGLAIGASEAYFRERMGAKEKLVLGTWFTGDEDEIIAGAKIAEMTGAKIGDEILLLGTTQDGSLSPVKGKLIGVVKMGSMLDRQLFLPLEKLQYLTDIPEGATELLVYGSDHRAAPELAERIRALPELREWEVQLFNEREPWKSMGATVESMQSIIVFVVLFLAALGIWNTTMMSVLERTHEIGVLRAMGLSRIGTVLLFVGEAMTIGVVGGIAGIAFGLYPAWLLETHGITLGEKTATSSPIVVSETMRGDLSAETIATAFVLGLVMAVVGSVVPAIRAAMIQPVSAMRSGR